MSEAMVICNKADISEECRECKHGVPHKREQEYISKIFCTEWGECSGEYGDNEIKVRCVKGGKPC